MCEQDEMYEMLQMLMEYKQFNKLEFIKPYPYQLKFMDASAHYKIRANRSSNRCGKSFSACLELAQHLTGRYQDYFTGERIKDSGHEFWCVGVDLSSVARVLQKELIGTEDIRVEDKIGTGMIPRDCIATDLPMIKDGSRLVSVQIKHVDGGYNTLKFWGSNNEAAMMGSSVKFVLVDEEPPYNSQELLSQLITRTATTQGHILLSFTPEQGYTALNNMLDNDTTGQIYLQTTTWDDVPHLTEEDKKRLLAGIPAWQHDMRSKGIPFQGSGAVFNADEKTYLYDTLDYNNPSLEVNHSCDFGITTDASVIMTSMIDNSTGIIYIDDEIYLDQSQEARAPDNMARCIIDGHYPNSPVIVPHDSGLKSTNPQAKARIMEQYGVVNLNLHKNPPSINRNNDSPSAIIPALDLMALMMRDGRLKINKRCVSLLKEIRGYYYQSKTGGGVVPVGSNGDHAIDATRYGVCGLLRGIHLPLDVASVKGADRWSEVAPEITNTRPNEWASSADAYLNKSAEW